MNVKMDNNKEKIYVGSRKSELALIQTRHVISLLRDLHPEKDFEIVTMNTLGDKILDIPLPKIGEKSLFTKELETALTTGHVDFVVHSLKDLPTQLPDGMAIGAVLTREDPRDALVMHPDYSNCSLKTLPAGSVIGTSSLRRTAQLAKKFPNLKVENIRGNLNTRLKKLDELGKYNAIILATAGLVRMGWHNRITKVLEPDDILYAVGQGALAVECRANDNNILEMLLPLYDIQTGLRVLAERSFLKTLGGGCSAPVAIYSNLKNIKERTHEISLKGAVWSLDGKEEVCAEDSCEILTNSTLKCTQCPYKNGDLKNIEDICANCPSSPIKEPRSKRAKIDDIPSDVLKNDPHEHCPIQMPVGADFMGKCPYLEVNDNIKTCPFTKDGKLKESFQLGGDIEIVQKIVASTSQENVNNNKTEQVRLYCGMILHKDVGEEAFSMAENLGIRLAKKLISKGALEVMKTAQDIIHGTNSTS